MAAGFRVGRTVRLTGNMVRGAREGWRYRPAQAETLCAVHAAGRGGISGKEKEQRELRTQGGCDKHMAWIRKLWSCFEGGAVVAARRRSTASHPSGLRRWSRRGRKNGRGKND